MSRLTIKVTESSMVLTVFFLVVVLFPVFGAETPEEEKAGPSLGGYQFSGSVSVGYRIVDIDKGRNAFYREVVNLNEGGRLLDFTLRGERSTEEPKLIDRFMIDAVNIGDPYPRIRLRIAKDKAYDFNVNLRESSYFVDRTDDAFSDNQNFDIRRRFGDVTLALFPSDALKVSLFYHRVERDGDSTVPRTIEDNVFVLDQPIDETANEVGAAVDLFTRYVDVRLEQSYRKFDGDNVVRLPRAGLSGLRPEFPFSTMQLNAFREEQDQEVETYVTRLQLRSALTRRWELTGGYVFAHANGSSTLQTTESGVGRLTPSGPTESFTTLRNGQGDIESNIHIVEVGSSYALLSTLLFHLDYRFHLVDQDGQGLLQQQRTGSISGTFTSTDSGTQDINIDAHTLSAFFEYLPFPTLTLRAGYRYQLRAVEVEQVDNGLPVPDDPFAAAPQLDRTTHGHGAIFSADWRYKELIQASVKYDGSYFDDPYTRIGPTRDNRIRARVRIAPVKWFAISEIFTVDDIANSDTETSTLRKAWTTAVFLQPFERLTLDGSLTYEDLNHRSDTFIPIDGIRTPTQFTNDSEALSYTINSKLDILKNLQARGFVSWTKVTGEGSSTYVFPGGELSYLWEKTGLRLTTRYERPYVMEVGTPEDEFFAHLITLILSKDF